MDVFDLVAKIRLDSSEYEQGIGKAKGTFSTLASGVKTGLATVAKVGAAAVAAGVAGVTALTKMGVDGYKEYEQLAGGAKLLWGSAYKDIASKAANAYATVQMSQSEYLQQVNGFSVGLKTALGGNEQAAATLADKIITAEADIVAATGATKENVQNAFNGIMKNNFSMVDNLGLGITATKEGFQTMIDSVNAYNVAHGNSTKYTIDNVADCQAALVDYVAMQGMAGYAGMEAAGTIEGSVAMMKSAWQNLVVGMADPDADLGVLITNMVTSADLAAKQLMPAITRTLSGIGDVIKGLAPVIGEALPQLVVDVLPSLLSAGVSLVTSLVQGVVSALPALYTALLDGVKIILVEVFGVSEEKAGEFANSVNSFFVKIKDGFLAMVQSAQTDGTWLNSIWTGLKDTGAAFCEFCVALWDALSAAFTWCVEQINTNGTWLNMIWNNIKTFISGYIDVIKNILKLFTAVLKGDWSAAWEAVKNIVETVWKTITTALTNYWNAIKNVFNKALEAVKSAVSEKFDAVKEKITKIFNNVKETISNAWDTIKSVVNVALMFIVELISAAFDLITLPFRFIWENCKETIMTVWEAIKTAVSNALDAIKTTISNVWNAIVSVLSPILNTIKTTVSSVWDAIKSAVSTVMDSIKSTVSTAWDGIKSSVSSAIDGVKSAISSGLNAAQSTVSGILDSIKSKFSSIWDSCKSAVTTAIDTIKSALNFSWSLPEIKLPHFSISGSFSLNPPSVPDFSISWYKKAYESAMVLGSPTIFGYSAASGKFLGGGDGNGNEIVAGESYLANLIGNVVEGKTAQQNERIVSVLVSILEAITGGNKELLRAMLEGQTIVLNNREFGRAVREYAR